MILVGRRDSSGERVYDGVLLLLVPVVIVELVLSVVVVVWGWWFRRCARQLDMCKSICVH